MATKKSSKKPVKATKRGLLEDKATRRSTTGKAKSDKSMKKTGMTSKKAPKAGIPKTGTSKAAPKESVRKRAARENVAAESSGIVAPEALGEIAEQSHLNNGNIVDECETIDPEEGVVDGEVPSEDAGTVDETDNEVVDEPATEESSEGEASGEQTAIEWKVDFPKSDFDKYGLIARDDLKADMIKAGLSGDTAEYNRIKTVLKTFDENQKVEGLKYDNVNTERRGMDNQIILD